ncbi:MAG: 3-phosphoshikimate 1-carboxyvinyltransferase [Endomicrobium sp.]|jgi:3-phosphoshikimate 1-carboxyvinyltransferase|nr:3-phosphoshikimate 1-carboxyvinyltransferase [Endomicrobium sp.]
MKITLSKANKIEGTIEVPADKSITHRAIMLSSLAQGRSIVRNYLPSDDCIRTIDAFKKMGVEIKQDAKNLYIKGIGLKLNKPRGEIYAGNSGTTTRLISGILAGQTFESVITGDESLSKRPMRRVIDPLTKMGAQFMSNNGLLPLKIKGQNPLNAISYESDKSSAQVKSAVLFAGLYAKGKTVYIEPVKSRDHSERMLKAFGAQVEIDRNNVSNNVSNKVSILPAQKLNPQDISVPGDISSAAFFIAAALLVPNSNLTIKNVNVNPTRDGFIEVLQKMGADISINNVKEVSGEPVADIAVKYSKLKSLNLDAQIIPRMIDEIPIFALIASKAQGVSKVSGAGELRVKESDRIAAIVSQFSKIGVEIKEFEDGFEINGRGDFAPKAAEVESYKDHRIAMTLAVASLISQGETTINDAECVNISFPNFYELLKSASKS